MTQNKNQQIIYKDLSYKIIGSVYDVYNQLGCGHQEKFYQKAIATALNKENIVYKREFYSPLKYKNEKIGNYFLDFLIEDKIILEIKKGNKVSRRDIEQVYAYLKNTNLKLGLIIRFTPQSVLIKGIVNIK
jgi:GxxExxY protein